eukprot:TRINITY_DN12979_c0_g1_i1.p1 TRINITY_DN12979_c0_g1~~TRINITY_DN12979_c0_g1_i1.p1  ORF type:complete len:364 (+),score=33.74 TRINITY_DN12979_c0_g1_i1:6-1097(+)
MSLTNISFSNTTWDINITKWEDVVFVTCGSFSAAATLASIVLIYNHLRHWSHPEHQTYIVRLLLMVPIYAIDSWLSIRFKAISLYLDIFRDCYEAYVLYQFFALLVSYITTGVYATELTEVLKAKSKMSHPCPCCCLPRFKPGPLFLLITKQCILQYVVVRPLMAVVATGLSIGGVYNEGDFSPTSGFLWVTLTINVSVAISMYFLVLFYLATRKQLKPYRPVAKLMSIKAILFFSFWQQVVLGVLVFFDVIPAIQDWEQKEVANGLNNFIVCIEMFLLAIVHHFVFPYKEYISEDTIDELDTTSAFLAVKNFGDVINQQDMISDFKTAYSPRKMKNAQAVQKVLNSGDFVSSSSTSESYGDL